jgi:signal transduction histidine kinase
VVIALLFQFPGLATSVQHGRAGGYPAPVLTTAALLVAFLSSFLLLAMRKHPGPIVAIVGVLVAPAIALGSGPPLAGIVLAFAVVSGIIRGARIWVWSTLAGLAVVWPLAAYLLTSSSVAIIRPLMTALVLCLLVGIGEAIRNRRERYRELSRQVAARRQSAAEAERVRIARELHDVLAHSLSQISVQAGVGLHLFESQPERARESLAAIKTTSSQALEEVRGVLGFLRAEGEPAARSPEPDLERLPSLVASFVQAGLAVRLTNRLPAGIPSASQLAIFRIVQESLTNAGRHAQASQVSVVLEDDGGDHLVTITDDGRGGAPEAEQGRGLVGMRERAELLGGTLEAGPVPGGGFRVRARIPARSHPDAVREGPGA